MKNKILVLGYFGYLTNQLDGQTIKTRNVYGLLKSKEEQIGEINYFDTQQFQKDKFSILKMFMEVINSKKLVYLPAQNNLKYIFPIIYFLCKFRKIDIIYIPVGGWLAAFLNSKKLHIYLLKKIRVILPEVISVKNYLEIEYNFKNVIYLPNFRIHSFIPSFKSDPDEFKIVFMARIMLIKGIDKVFNLAKYLEDNSENYPSIKIDFYGQIDKTDEIYFLTNIKNHKNVNYCGVLHPEKIYNTLEKYDLLVLPTKYSGEGFPGTILDAYISGIPVVVSNWKHSTEFVDDGETGFIFDLEKEMDFYFLVEKLYSDKSLLHSMQLKAYEKSKLYSPEIAWNIIRDYLIES